MNVVIGIAGKIGSGKSTLSNEIAKHLKCNTINTGDYFRAISLKRNLSTDRSTLQQLGNETISIGWDYFSKELLNFANWSNEKNLLIAGIRNVKLYEQLKKDIHPNKFYLIYIDTLDEVRRVRIKERVETEKKLDFHPVEAQVEELKKFADLILDNNRQIDMVKEDALIWIKNILKEMQISHE
ncbi:hypothetical protein D0U04_20710 [Bacillus clarus]|uniref:Adenylate kinase family protein n=1 Tax=Bacillus clarus TaxID=2338372 RepID=A0A090YKZ8_9BACI|nr:AAA family ATPase [Bacillus clarus]KFM99109.1 adenylate kinase family protein [Bacillus clarus]RFT64898.1 hypothetical protein D0U04_20710 [Bacillus clarus]